MALRLPNYLLAADIQSNSIRYEWDDWRTLPAKQILDEELVARLEGTSQRAVLAFACGSAEWMVRRFATLSDDPRPWDYVEGAWAMTIDVRYCGYAGGRSWAQYSVDGWEGPVKGPIAEALSLVESAIQQLAWEGTPPVLYAGPLATLVAYVMPDPTPYRRWCREVMDRLESLYPLDPDDELGDVVPEQAVDPTFDFAIEQTETLVNDFLSRLDHRSNIFLSSPQGMLEPDDEGRSFRGTPYVFSIEADRLRRREVEEGEGDGDEEAEGEDENN
jgi:hypothetical protein